MNPSNALDFHTKALVLRAERQRLLASNIANADTPGYQARDFTFAQALTQATGGGGGGLSGSSATLALALPSAGASVSTGGLSNSRHMPLGGAGSGGVGTAGGGAPQGYAVQTQPSMDNNTVDLDRERAAFADNAVRYEATLRFINGQSKTLLAAITGQ